MTELKTLKDLNEEFRKDNIPQRLSGDEFNDFWEEKLRAEAVKWVKQDNFSVDREWIKHFFNLTEADLQEAKK